MKTHLEIVMQPNRLILAGLLLCATRLQAQVDQACKRDGPPRAESRAIRLHPDRVEERYGELIASRQWMPVLNALEQDTRLILDSLSGGGTPAFVAAQGLMHAAVVQLLDSLPKALDVSLATRAGVLQRLEINKFEPSVGGSGQWRLLQSRAQGLGIPLGSDLRPDEVEALCWSGRSVSRILNGVNYETLPGALAHIVTLGREWERYRWNGPVQLLHELALNRVLRTVVRPTGDARYHPPKVDLVAIHPFAGVELVRENGSIKQGESFALETGGFTVWFNEWKQFVGASWVLAYDADGRIGRGPLVRVSKYATAGVLFRKDAGGTSRKSLLLTVDVLRIFKPDAAAGLAAQTRGIVGELVAKQ